MGQIQPIVTPAIDWLALSPCSCWWAALFLLTAAALASGRPPRGFYALFTVVTAVLAMVCSGLAWGRVTDPARGPTAPSLTR